MKERKDKKDASSLEEEKFPIDAKKTGALAKDEEWGNESKEKKVSDVEKEVKKEEKKVVSEEKKQLEIVKPP